MQLKILGSVSPYPTKNSNCIGYLIKDNDNKILIDCGNGITKEMKFPDDLNNLTIILSHLHKDHYGDLCSIAYASYVYHKLGLLKDQIKVYIPEDNSNEYNYLMNYGNEHYFNFIPYKEDNIININDINISFKQTKHPVMTYAMNIIKENIKISYSSDTGYDESLINFFNKANILICESSFLESQKNSEYHLTATEAATLAKKSNVDKLILTHFWPEIDKQQYVDEAKKIFKRTSPAIEKNVI